jgi:hypothetical protein
MRLPFSSDAYPSATSSASNLSNVADSSSVNEASSSPEANREKARSAKTFKSRYDDFRESAQRRLPALGKKIEFIAPPVLSILHKIAKDAPIPYAQNCVEILTCLYNIATLVRNQR